MGTSWDHSTAIDNKESWDETIYSWKASNILGWSLSTVLGMYTSAFGVTKQQLMLGWERKINILPKYEWYYWAPTKILADGENKIDFKESKKVAANKDTSALMWSLMATDHSIEAFNKAIKTANETKTVTGITNATYGTHVMTCRVGGSQEQIEFGNKTIDALAGSIALTSGPEGVAIKSGGGSIQVLPAAIKIQAPTIEIG